MSEDDQRSEDDRRVRDPQVDQPELFIVTSVHMRGKCTETEAI